MDCSDRGVKETPASESERCVYGYVRGQDVFIWSADDAVWLRREWRVTGGLVGALPGIPRQNIHLGLPLCLAPEETSLLLAKGVLKLKEYAPLKRVGAADIERFEKLRSEDFSEQFSAYKERVAKARLRWTSLAAEKHSQRKQLVDIHIGEPVSKRAKLEPAVSQKGRSEGKEEEEEEEERKQESVGGGGGGGGKAKGSSKERDWGSFSPLVCIGMSDPRKPDSFKCVKRRYPNNQMEWLRSTVYSDLWHKGYYLTSGLKYGGDYLVYPGDPGVVHSQFIAVVLPWEQVLPSIVGCGRLGSKVKKNTLLCSVVAPPVALQASDADDDDDDDEKSSRLAGGKDLQVDLPKARVRYFTLQWTGFA